MDSPPPKKKTSSIKVGNKDRLLDLLEETENYSKPEFMQLYVNKVLDT